MLENVTTKPLSESTPLIDRSKSEVSVVSEAEETSHYMRAYVKAPLDFFVAEMGNALDDSTEASRDRHPVINGIYCICTLPPVTPVALIVAMPIVAVATMFGLFAGAARDCYNSNKKNETSRPASPFNA